jgi:hypothetical protein
VKGSPSSPPKTALVLIAPGLKVAITQLIIRPDLVRYSLESYRKPVAPLKRRIPQTINKNTLRGRTMAIALLLGSLCVTRRAEITTADACFIQGRLPSFSFRIDNCAARI